MNEKEEKLDSVFSVVNENDKALEIKIMQEILDAGKNQNFQ